MSQRSRTPKGPISEHDYPSGAKLRPGSWLVSFAKITSKSSPVKGDEAVFRLQGVVKMFIVQPSGW